MQTPIMGKNAKTGKALLNWVVAFIGLLLLWLLWLLWLLLWLLRLFLDMIISYNEI